MAGWGGLGPVGVYSLAPGNRDGVDWARKVGSKQGFQPAYRLPAKRQSDDVDLRALHVRGRPRREVATQLYNSQ